MKFKFFHGGSTPKICCTFCKGKLSKSAIRKQGRRFTSVTVIREGLPPLEGLAMCSLVDNFSRAKGRVGALAAALKGLSPKEKALVWEEYWRTGPRVPA